MADINFFDMTYDEMLKYKMNPKNHIHTSSVLNGDQIIGAGFKAINPFDDMPRQTVVERDFFAKPRMKEPELWDSGRIVNMENVRIQKAKVKAQMREAQNNAEFDPMNRLVERTPEALATDTRIQQLLSEADTMVRRYNLPSSAAHALKVDIMKSHLPDYIMKKDTLTQKQQDEMMAKIMASIEANKQTHTMNNLAPDEDAGGDENRDRVGHGGFEGEDNESVDTAIMDEPSTLRPTGGAIRDPTSMTFDLPPASGVSRVPTPLPATSSGKTTDPATLPALSGVGNDLEQATQVQDAIQIQADSVLRQLKKTLSNGSKREKEMVRSFIDTYRTRGRGSQIAIDSIENKLIKKPGKIATKPDEKYRQYFRELFNVGSTMSDEERGKIEDILEETEPEIFNLID